MTFAVVQRVWRTGARTLGDGLGAAPPGDTPGTPPGPGALGDPGVDAAVGGVLLVIVGIVVGSGALVGGLAGAVAGAATSSADDQHTGKWAARGAGIGALTALGLGAIAIVPGVVAVNRDNSRSDPALGDTGTDGGLA